MGQMTKPLERYALILEVLSRFPEGLSLTEISGLAQLPKATTHRIIKALVNIGYVSGGNGRVAYRLGPRLLRMMHFGEAPTWIGPLVEPSLRVLVQDFDETAFLAKLIGLEVRSVAMVLPKPTDRSYVHPGRVMPVNAAASAKAIMASQPEETVGQVLANQPLAKYTPSTCVDSEELKRQYAQIRRAGHALCIDELDPGVMSIAAPIQTEGIGTFYSVGLVGLQPRLSNFPRQNLVAGLRTASESIAKLLRSRRTHPSHEAAPSVLGEDR